jgi:hypothetical protein
MTGPQRVEVAGDEAGSGHGEFKGPLDPYM